MSELQASMGGRRKRSAAIDREPTSAAGALEQANRSAGKPYPHRVALDLNREQLRALRQAHTDDGIPITTRARALVALWREDPELQRKAADVARRDMSATRRIGK